MKIQHKFDNNIIKTAIMTLILALICVIIPVAITSHAQETIISKAIECGQSSYYLAVGDTAQIDAYIFPENTANKKLVFKSGDESICTVDENGLITGISFGSTEITVSAEDGGADPERCKVTVKRSINKDNTEIRLESDTHTYTGYIIQPRAEIYSDGKLLSQDTDYEIVYSDNIDVGTANIKIYGIGDYYGELEREFTIIPKNIKDVLISGIPFQTYKGTAITPDIDAYPDATYKTHLVNGADYTLTYSNNINAGTALVTVKGKGNYEGEMTLDFIIYPADIKYDVTIPSVSRVTYSGKAVTPKVSPHIDGYSIVLNKDYTVSYSNNVKIGQASITIKGIGGNVTGTKVINFQIVPAANKLTSYGVSKKTSLRLKWTKSSGITGYKIYVYDTSKKIYVRKKTITNPNTVLYTIKGLKPGITYSFKIATFVRINGVDYISYLSDGTLLAMTVPANSKIVQVCGENHSATIRWKKIEGASGYIVYRYNKKTKKYARIAKVKGNTVFTYTNKKLKKSKTYSYKVKAYKTLNGKTLKGKTSGKRSVLTLSFRWPVPGFYYISQTYNNKSSMYASGNHSGTDIASNGKSIKGAKIIATKGGIVDSVNKGCKHNYGKSRSCGCGGGFGNYVVVRSTFKIDGKKVTLRVIYGHMTSVKVKVGQYVSSGQLLGTVGSTGYSTGPHLHFEFRVQDSPNAKIKKRLNPLNYVKH